MNSDAPPTGKKKSFAAKLLRPKVALPLTLLVLLLISPFLIRGWHLRGVPNVPEPFDTRPIRELKVADADNAYTGYAEALDLFVQPNWDLREKSNHVLQAGWKAADDDVRQFLKNNERALLVWKEATGKDQAQYLPADEYAWDQVLTVAGEARSVTRGALLIAEQQMAEGQPAQAWEWYRAAIRFSRHLGNNGVLVERLIGADCFELTARQRERWLADPSVSRDLIRSAMHQLQQDWQRTEERTTIIKNEYIIFSNLIEQIENGESHVLKSQAWSNGLNSVRESETPNIVYWLYGEPELSKRLGRIWFENQLRFYALPPWERPPIRQMGLFDDPEGLSPEHPELTINRFNTLFERSRAGFPAIVQSMIDIEADELRYRSLLVVFAGQAFRRDRGRFPKTLDELVPEYLDSIPTDNYDGKPLKYRFDPEGAVVYSVFKNLADDGGIEWSRENLPSGKRHPDDYGSQMRLPEPEPLTAPKP